MRRTARGLTKFPALYSVFLEQGSGHAGPATDAAGGAARFEQGQVDVPRPGNGQHLPGALDKLFADIHAVPVDHRGPARQDIMAVATCNPHPTRRDNKGGESRGWQTREEPGLHIHIGRGAWRGQAAELFRTDGQPVHFFKQGKACSVRFAPAVVAGAETGQAGADQAFCRQGHFLSQWYFLSEARG